MEYISQPANTSYTRRVQDETRVMVYFIPSYDDSGKKHYNYIAVNILLHDKLMQALADGEIPDYAVVLATGEGEPSPEVKQKIRLYYGFDHEKSMAALEYSNDNSEAGAEAVGGNA